MHVRITLGGIVGNSFPRYHLFGPHAKMSAVLEQAGSPLGAVVSDAFRRLLMQPEEDAADQTAASPITHSRVSMLSMTNLTSNLQSWNVATWSAKPKTFLASADGEDVPDEIGPVVLAWNTRNCPVQAVRLKRLPDIAESVFESQMESLELCVNAARELESANV